MSPFLAVCEECDTWVEALDHLTALPDMDRHAEESGHRAWAVSPPDSLN